MIAYLVTAAMARDRAVASAPPRGALTLLTGPGACVGSSTGRSTCTRLRGATALVRIAVSPDGRNLYLSGQAGGLSILARDGRTGRIHQLGGRGGCFRRDGRQGCALLRTLTDPAGLTVSPDGRDVYVTTTHGVLGFARNRRSGALRPLTGAGRCVDATRPGCRPLRGLRAPTELTTSGNGTLYVAGSVPPAAAPTGALAVLSRTPATGALSQHAGPVGCFDDVSTPGCTTAPCLDTLPALAPARDRRHFYVGSTDSLNIEETSPGALATFASSPATGALTYIGCVTTVNAISSVVPKRSGTGVFVNTTFGNRGTGRAEATIDLFAPGPGGLLTRVRRFACAQARGCQIPINFDVSSVLALTPRGDTLYYVAQFWGIAALRVGSHGLRALPGRAACVVDRRYYMPPPRCTPVGEAITNDIAVSPDGRNLYVGFIGPPGGHFYGGGIETFKIRR